jgi:hypothetical protein
MPYAGVCVFTRSNLNVHAKPEKQKPSRNIHVSKGGFTFSKQEKAYKFQVH